MDTLRNVARGTFLLFVGRLAASGLGVLYLVLLAGKFGASHATDALFVANSIPFLFVGAMEPSLNLAFIPTFVHRRETGDAEGAWVLAGTLLKGGAFFLLCFGFVMAVMAPYVVQVLAPGFAPDTRALTIGLVRISALLPLLSFVAAFLMAMNLVACRFLACAVSTVVGGCGGPVALVLFANRYGVTALPWAALVSSLAQIVILASVFNDIRQILRGPLRLTHPAVRQMARVLGPRMAAISLDQANFLVGTFFASSLGAGCVSYLGYALRVIGAIRRMVLQPLGRVLIPVVARHAALGELAIIRGLVVNIVTLAGFLLIPAFAFVAGFRNEILALVLQRGAFGAESTAHTGLALLCYSLGMISFVLNPVLDATFFCLQDSRSPLRVAAPMGVAHAALVYLLMNLLGYAGIALAGSVVAGVASVLLWRLLERKVGALDGASVLSSLGRSLLAAAGMVAASLGVGMVVAGTAIGHPISRLALCALVATAAYALLQFLLNRRVCRQVLGFLRSDEPVVAEG